MDSIVSTLIQTLGKEKVLTGDQLESRYTHIWKMHLPLQAKALILASNTEDVSETLKICHLNNQAVLVHGGLTNLVGSTETNGDEVIISTEKMNIIEEIDPASRSMTVQAGVILENIIHKANEHDLLFPQNFGAKGSAQIGGVISTNAGGLRVFKYGMTRNLVLGLEVVLADGRIISSMKKIIKDNSAYDLKQLFIGSEGTLGVVTRAVLKLVEAPKSRNSAYVGIDEYEKVVSFLKYMDQALAGTLSSFELIWKDTYLKMTDPVHQIKRPIAGEYNYYVLIESLGSDQNQDHKIMETLLTNALQEQLILDAVMTHTSSDLDWFWGIRENVSVLRSASLYDQHFDVSVPIAQIGAYAAAVSEQILRLKEVEAIYIFGHVADGNIHFIVNKTKADSSLSNEVNEIVYGPIKKLGGSVSAEHGIGLDKKNFLKYCRSAEEIDLMKQVKSFLDPKGILNPGKIF